MKKVLSEKEISSSVNIRSRSGIPPVMKNLILPEKDVRAKQVFRALARAATHPEADRPSNRE